MDKFPFDIVLFDLDGTLVDSARDLCPAVNHALSIIGRGPVAESATRGMIGGGAEMMLTRALEATGGMVAEDEYRRLSEALLTHYWAHIADNTVPYPGCIEALEQLASLGCTLAVCTNKSEKGARELLGALDLSRHFTAIYGGDTLGRERAKPLPDMLHAAITDCGGGRAVMIGDTTFDVLAAKAAKLPVVTCGFGYIDAPVSELASKFGSNANIDHFDELVPALKRLT